MDYDTEDPTEFQMVRADAMRKGHLTREDLFRMYRAAVSDVEQLERDLAHVSENRPDVNINADCSLEWARVEQAKPDGYDEWAFKNPTTERIKQ